MHFHRQRGSEGVGDAIGWAVVALPVVIVAIVTTSPSWLAGNVRTTYQQCIAAAHTAADQHACDPSAPPTARP
jgi:hypothetical protein